MDSLSQDVIKAIAAHMQDQTPNDQRVIELAAEVGRLNGAVRRERRRIRFGDEPAQFFWSLEHGAR